MDYGLLVILIAVVIGIDVYHAVKGKPDAKVKARQSLLMILIALTALAIWRAGSTLLTDNLGVDEIISMLLMAVAAFVPAALIYNKFSGRISGLTPEQQARKLLEKYADRGDFVAAIQQGHKLVVHNSSAENFYLLGRCYELNKDHKRALKYYTSSVEIDPEFYMAYNNMGTCYLNLKKNELAKEVLEKAYELKPEHPFVPANLAFTYACLGDTEKARDFLKKAKTNGYTDGNDEILHKIEAAEKTEE